MMRAVLLILILSLMVVSIGGYIAVNFDLLPQNLKDIYNNHFSFVTGLASVIGLLAFASSRKIKSTDFDSEELEKFKSLMKTAEELETIEQNKSQTAKDLQELERKKKVMEISVKKAGLVLFYRAQTRKYTEVINQKLDSDEDFKSAIEELGEAKLRLNALKEEIEQDENVEIIMEILEKSEKKTGVQIEDPILILVNKFASRVINNINNFFRI